MTNQPMELADNPQRLKNYLIDSFICGIVTIILYALAVLLLRFNDKDEVFFTYYPYIYLLVRTIYYIAFEHYFFRTPGKIITRTKVCTLEGKAPSFGLILLRSFCRLIPFNPISFLFGGNWHDRMSGTIVVKDDELPANAPVHPINIVP